MRRIVYINSEKLTGLLTEKIQTEVGHFFHEQQYVESHVKSLQLAHKVARARSAKSYLKISSNEQVEQILRGTQLTAAYGNLRFCL